MKNSYTPGIKSGMAGFAVLAVVSIVTFVLYVLGHTAGSPKIMTSSSAAYAISSVIALVVYGAAGAWSARLGWAQGWNAAGYARCGAIAGVTVSLLATVFDMALRVAGRMVVVGMGLIPENTLSGMALFNSLILGTIAITWERGLGLLVTAAVLGAIGGWWYARRAPGNRKRPTG